MQITTIKVPSDWKDRKDCNGTAFVGTLWKNMNGHAELVDGEWIINPKAPSVHFDAIEYVIDETLLSVG